MEEENKPEVINIDYKTNPEKIIKKTDIVVQGGLDPKALLTNKEKLVGLLGN